MKCEDVENGLEVVSQYVSFSCDNGLVFVKIGDDQWQLCDCLSGSTFIFNGMSFELVCAHGMALVCISKTDEQHWLFFLFHNDEIRGGQGIGDCFLLNVVDGNHTILLA